MANANDCFLDKEWLLPLFVDLYTTLSNVLSRDHGGVYDDCIKLKYWQWESENILGIFGVAVGILYG